MLVSKRWRVSGSGKMKRPRETEDWQSIDPFNKHDFLVIAFIACVFLLCSVVW